MPLGRDKSGNRNLGNGNGDRNLGDAYVGTAGAIMEGPVLEGVKSLCFSCEGESCRTRRVAMLMVLWLLF